MVSFAGNFQILKESKHYISCDLLMDTYMSSEQRNFVKVINKSSSMLLNLISNILDFSRIEAGKLELEETRFNLKECIQGVIATVNMKTLSTKKKNKHENLTIKLNESDIPEWVVGDEVRLTQILVNLLGNAVKFSNDKGTITVDADYISEEGNENPISSEFLDLRFNVTDQGIGIPIERRDALFKRFSQVDTSISKSYGGAGLGLAICKSIVESMGGEIWIDKSELGVGTTFSFTCRMKRFTDNILPSKLEDHSLDDNFDLSNARILVAEDNSINRKVMSAMLEGIGVRHFKLCEDGQVAFDEFQQNLYDLVLMDLNMPRVSGLDATRLIREYEDSINKSHCAVIAVTANATELQRDECIQAGMTTFVTKPIRKQTLRRVIASNLRAVNHETVHM
jgi:CheY-like chemotaxis protein